MKRIIAVAVLLLMNTPAASDSVIWDYDLRSAPAGWTFTSNWEFLPEGVKLYEYVSQPYGYVEGTISTENDTAIIPYGCDSIVFHVEQDLSVTSYNYGGAHAELLYRLNGGDWVELFSVSNYYISTDPLHYQIPAAALDALEFYFEGYAWRGSEMHPGWGCISWLLYDLTLTCYGELALEQSTWGAIKQSMR